MGKHGPPEERFWRFVEFDNSGCWKWTGYLDKLGYARFSVATSTNVHAQRFAYEMLRGPIPGNKHTDHLCRHPWCVNPFHLEIVTAKVNVLRGVGPTAQNARKTHCKNGHLLAGENLIIHHGNRQCRECTKRRRREWYLANGR